MTVRTIKLRFLSAENGSIVVKSVETAKQLNKDCGLVEAEELDKNLKQFLAHIGESISGYLSSKLTSLMIKERVSRWWFNLKTRKIDISCT
jgi:hypothetical protein